MSAKHPQNTTPRQYYEKNGFEIRSGKFYDPNEKFNGIRFEIRILHKDQEFMEILLELIKDWITK